MNRGEIETNLGTVLGTCSPHLTRSWRFPSPIAYRQETLAIIHKGSGLDGGK